MNTGLFSMLGPELLADPYALYRRLHDTDPVLRVDGLFGIGGWVVTSHAVCSTVLRSKQFGKEGARVLLPEKLANIPQEALEIAERRKNNMLFRDPPDHTRLRGLVTQAFTPRTIERLRPRIEEIAEHLLDAVSAHGSMDVIADYAFPLPIIVIAELLGVPSEDRGRFKAWSTDLTMGLNPAVTPEDLVKVGVAVKGLDAYMRQVIEARRASPKSDLISALVGAHEQGDKLSMDELLATCRLILTAGHETTVNLIGNGLLALLRNETARDSFLADPTVAENAVEELLRYDSPVQMTLRFAFEDGPLGGHEVKRGDLVVALIGGANRDPEHFADPDRIDLRRANAHSNLAFGGGIHYCLGAPLARLEGAIAFRTLFRRMPKLALTDVPLTWRRNPVLRGLQAMPVTF